MNILFSCLFVTSFVICYVHSIDYVIIPETCTEPLFSCPDDCTKYYVCLHGRPFKMPCGPGTHWNDRLKVCDWPHNANCTEVPTIHPGDPIPTEPTPPPLKPTEPTPTEAPTTDAPVTPKPEPNENMKVICYFTNAASREPVRYQPEDVKWSLCSHIIYAFAIADPETFTIRAADPWADIDNKYYEKITALRRDGVKISIAVNGLVDNIDGTANPILTDANTRRKFVESASEFIEKYNFDGLELDLEYALCSAEDCESQILQERSGFIPLMEELSAVLKPRGLLLSATASANQEIIDLAYDIPKWSALLDWISIMAFDFHSSIDGQTGQKSPIYSNDNLNVDYTVNYYIKKGAAHQKLIVGVAGYGQSFTLSSDDHELNAVTTGPGEPGPYSKVRGLLAYYEICDYTQNEGWSVVRSSDSQNNTFAYSDKEWVSFDDVDNIRAKAQYIQKMGLGGGLFWTMDFDDFTAKCGCGRYPLLTAFNQELRQTGGKPIHNCT